MSRAESVEEIQILKAIREERSSLEIEELFDRVPDGRISREVCLEVVAYCDDRTFFKRHKVPRRYLDENFFLDLIMSYYVSLKNIPEEYRTRNVISAAERVDRQLRLASQKYWK